MLIRFTSKSCGICERFSKEWEEIVRTSNKKHIMSVDCDKDLKFCLERNILSFPSFQTYNQWEGFHTYVGSTDKKVLKAYIKSLVDNDCYVTKTCSKLFNIWLENTNEFSLEEAKKELNDVNTRFLEMFKNITIRVSDIKRAALEKTYYINKYHN